MTGSAVTTVREARAAANEWLISHLPDRFATGVPEYDSALRGWRVSVWLSYPRLEPLGPVGEILVDEATAEVRALTPLGEMKARAASLCEERRDDIEASDI